MIEEVVVCLSDLGVGTGPIQKIDEATGEILCLVTEPAVPSRLSAL